MRLARISAPHAHLIAALDQAYRVRSWHGTNLRGSIRGLPIDALVWRPAQGRHNIWEIVVHCAYWKYVAWRRITRSKRGSFPLAGSDWFVRPVEASEVAWKADVQLLDDMHAQLRSAVAALTDRALPEPTQGTFTAADLVAGVTAHDLYHAGQIQLLKRLGSDRGQTPV